jgi:hypothetical protein
MSLMGERDQGVDAGLGLDDHTSAIATIATTRAASRNVFLTSEGHAAVAASTSDDLDFDTVDKHEIPSCGC